MDTEGSRLFTFTLFPFLSNPQKIHFGTSPTKTWVVPHGACKEAVQEQLHTSAAFCTEAFVFYIIPKTLGTEALQESHTECMFFTIFDGQEICPQGSLLCAFPRRSLCFCFSSSLQKKMPSNKIEQNLCCQDIQFWRPKIATALDSWHNLTTPEIKNKREGSQLQESLKMTTNLDCISK